MSFITDILKSNPIGAALTGVVDSLTTSSGEKAKAKLEIERLMAKHDSEVEETIRAELSAKERILVAELNQGDSYAKRARPTVVYAGLVMIAYNYCLAPSLGIERIDLPTEFWAGWSGIVATWSIGRSVEKSGKSNKVTKAITGSNLFG